MMGPVFAWPPKGAWAGICPPSSSLTLTLLLYPREDEKRGVARGNLEAAAGRRVCSEGTVKMNAESTAHGHQGAKDAFQRHDTNVLTAAQPPAYPLSLPGVMGTGAAIPLLD